MYGYRYNCDCKCNWLEAENATITQGTSATIITAPEALTNRSDYRLRYCAKFSDATGAEVLQINNGTTTYPVWDRNGEPVKIGRLRRRELLYLKFISTATAHFTLKNCLCPLCIKTPGIPAQAQA